MRLRKVKGAAETIAAHPEIVIPNGEALKGNWQSVFEKDQPLYIEVGMGKGQFVIGMAQKNPHLNFIGIEKFEGVIIQACDKLKENEPKNLHLVAGDATNLLNWFEKNEITKIFLNFSDPWPKSRHAKRRLTYKTYLDMYKVISNGEIEFKTDNRELFEFSLVSLNENNWKFLDLTFDLHKKEEDIITTEYEDKFSAKGNPIYFVRTKYKGE